MKDKAFLLLQIELAKKGNRQAQNKIIDFLWNPIFSHVSKKIRNENDAEDITIETFTKVLSKLRLYNEAFEFKTWVIAIAQNTLIDHLRKDPNGKHRIALEDDFSGFSQQEPSPEERLMLRQDNEKLMREIAKLKPKYREVIELRYLEDKTYKEIANRLNLSLANVKVRLMRARKLLEGTW